MLCEERKRIEARLLIHAQSLQNKLALIHYDIKDVICKEQEKREQNAVERIKSSNESIIEAISEFLQIWPMDHNCAPELCAPELWSESFELGRVHSDYKQAHISPLYKKGDRAKAVNYRPVALTSQ